MLDLVMESSLNASKAESQLGNQWDHKWKRCERGTRGWEACGKEAQFLSVFSVEYVVDILTLFFVAKRSEEPAQLEGETQKVLDKLEVNISPGLDGIHSSIEGSQMWNYRPQAKLSNLALQTATPPED